MAESKLNIEHIELINKELEQGASLNSLDKSGALGMSRKAYRNNALKLGYDFNVDKNQFIHDGVTEITPRNTKEVKVKKEVVKVDKYKELEERIKALEDLVLSNNTKVIHSDFELDSRVINSEITSRSVKVSKEALKEFTRLCEANLSMYSKQDLLSQALFEFADKYNR